MQNYIIYGIVIVCVVYLGRSAYKSITGKGSACGKCSGCSSMSNECSLSKDRLDNK